MSDKHSEVELKFHADNVNVDGFCSFCMALGPESYLHVISPDVYYKQGSNICRHRWSEGAGELTVKLRKDLKSTVDRVEIDLGFNHKTTTSDVTKFLQLTGWKRKFTVVKDAKIFFFNMNGSKSSVVIYDCWLAGKEKDSSRFIEIEAEKDTFQSKDGDLSNLEWWKRVLNPFLKDGICNLSLYEFYSGERYKLA